MALMTASGFCRNCMAKWLMESARTYVESNSPTDPSSAVLRSMVYNDFLHFVYDLDPKEWKAKYNGAPTQAQKDAYANSTNLHATHKEGIGSKTASVGSLVEDNSNSNINIKNSEVCCQNYDNDFFAQCSSNSGGNNQHQHQHPSHPKINHKKILLDSIQSQSQSQTQTQTQTQTPPSDTKFAVITVSDRAFTNSYSTGDLSGPACVRSIQNLDSPHSFVAEIVIVPDDATAIRAAILNAVSLGADCVVTTGGTGFSKRDVTIEAVQSIANFVEHETLMPYCLLEAAKENPLAVLSRGISGVIANSTMVCTLPGRGEAVEQVFDVLGGYIIRIISDLKKSQNCSNNE